MNKLTIFVDSSSRSLKCYAVNVTEIEERGLVIRKACDLGNFFDLVGENLQEDVQFLIPTKGYQARSSEGFVQILSECSESKKNIIGMMGMPFQKYPGMQIMGNPMEACFLNLESAKKISTQNNSNSDTAKVGRKAFELLAKVRKNSIFVLEGQSNSFSAVELVASDDLTKTNSEFREELFSDKNLTRSFLRFSKDPALDLFRALIITGAFLAPGTQHAYKIATFLTRIDLSKGWFFLKEGAKELVAEFLENGWKLEAEHLPLETKLFIFSPEGGKREFNINLIGTSEVYSGELFKISNHILSYVGLNSKEVRKMRTVEQIKIHFSDPETNAFIDKSLFTEGKKFMAGIIDCQCDDELAYKGTYPFYPKIEEETLEEVLSRIEEVSIDTRRYLGLISIDSDGIVTGQKSCTFHSNGNNFIEVGSITGFSIRIAGAEDKIPEIREEEEIYSEIESSSSETKEVGRKRIQRKK